VLWLSVVLDVEAARAYVNAAGISSRVINVWLSRVTSLVVLASIFRVILIELTVVCS
jgi:hypothetical protein